MSIELKKLLLDARIAVLSARGAHNDAIVKKLIRRRRQLGN